MSRYVTDLEALRSAKALIEDPERYMRSHFLDHDFDPKNQRRTIFGAVSGALQTNSGYRKSIRAYWHVIDVLEDAARDFVMDRDGGARMLSITIIARHADHETAMRVFDHAIAKNREPRDLPKTLESWPSERLIV